VGLAGGGPGGGRNRFFDNAPRQCCAVALCPSDFSHKPVKRPESSACTVLLVFNEWGGAAREREERGRGGGRGGGGGRGRGGGGRGGRKKKTEKRKEKEEEEEEDSDVTRHATPRTARKMRVILLPKRADVSISKTFPGGNYVNCPHG